MGALKVITGTIVFIIAMVVLMQPIFTILDATRPILDNASATVMYSTNSDGEVVATGHANEGGDLTLQLLYAIGFFMTIGFIIWLITRAPTEPDVVQVESVGRF